MSEPFEKSIEKWTDAELIEALRQSLPEMIPYGDMVGAEAPYCHSGPMVWQDAECYFMAEAANRLERYAPVRHGRWEEIEDFDGDSHWRCSACGCEWYFEVGDPTENGSNYCPNCGAKMDKVES